MQVAKWGNSLAVRLPKQLVDTLSLKEGDEIALTAADWREMLVVRTPSTDDVLQQLRAFRGRAPDDFVFDRDEANAR
jgi:antitoxin MazE